MSLTPSKMMPLGTVAPDFKLLDTISGKTFTRDTVKKAKGLLVLFICNHCPFVIHIEKQLASLGEDYQSSAIGIVAINSNDVASYPDDDPDRMRETAVRLGYSFPYLYDETQAVAHAYAAACTPDIYLFDSHLKCVYRGQFDGARPSNDIPVTGKDLRDALERLLNGTPPLAESEQLPSVGCSIKWKS